MQSTRRKREREEPAAAATGTRTSSRARSARAPKRAQNSTRADTDDEEMTRGSERQQPPSSSSSPAPESTSQDGNDQIDKNEVAAPAPMEIESNENHTEAKETKAGNEDSRQQQLARFVSHRKILLERVKKCRIAAQSRLERNSQTPRKKRPLPSPSEESKSEAADSTPASEKGASKAHSTDQKTVSDSDEVEEFRELMRIANQAVKKHRPHPEPSVEKRVSVSLRRGSSVGKRMNAALSSLAPGSHASTVSMPEVTSGLSAQPASKAPALAPLAPPASLTPPPGTLSNAKQPAILHPSKWAHQTASVVPTDASGTIRPTTAHKTVKRSIQKATKSAPMSRGGPSFSAFHSQGSNLPLSGGIGGGFPHNQLISTRSSVYFPEAHALRERRSVVRAKLTAMLQARQEKQLAVPSNTPWEWRSNSVPTRLPSRRKTHWDHLLEEMRWLATDFIEERKWKESSARTLASAVVTSNLSSVSTGTAKSGRETRKKPHGEEEARTEPSTNIACSKASVEHKADEMESTHEQESTSTMGTREYAHVTPDDLKALQTTAKVVSAMVTEVWDVVVDAGAFSQSDKAHRAALARILRLQEASLVKVQHATEASIDKESERESRKHNETGDTPELSLENLPASSAECITEKTTTAETEITTEESHALREASLERITTVIQSTTDRVAGRKARRSRTKTSDESVGVTPEQRKAIEFVEFVWNGDDTAGSILNGSSGSGKTLVTCSLLWRNRENGPQLLVCSPARLVRWTHELHRFPGLRVRVFGLSGGISSPRPKNLHISSYEASDVVVCEFASLFFDDDVAREDMIDLTSFYSVTIDSRHPLESLTQRGKHLNGKTLSKLGQGVSRLPTQRLVPVQLLMRSWWAPFLKAVGRTDAKRMFIENRGYLNKCGEGGYICDVLTEKQHMEFMAAKTAFALGPAVFLDENAPSVQHRVVSWAKHNLKDAQGSKRSKFEKVMNFLNEAMDPLRHSVDFSEEMAGTEQDSLDWEIRLCSLTAPQRTEYDRCCIGGRGGLSLDNVINAKGQASIAESCLLATKAILRLRNVCIHAHSSNILASVQSNMESYEREAAGIPFTRDVSQSVSQPRDDVAIDILKGSAKLRVLTTILRDMCGFEIASKAVSEILLKDADRGLSRRESPGGKGSITKVAILATLPEAQVLTSRLLNAIGISHDLLVRSPITTKATKEMEGPWTRRRANGNGLEDTVDLQAWIESQVALSQFNSCSSPIADGDFDGPVCLTRSPMGLTRCDVLVSSPMTVGADYGGLGIESAEVVICLDEDWSGREDYLMDRILERCRLAFRRSKQAGQSSNKSIPGGLTECRLIKLVCKDTCEETFISESDTRGEKSTVGENGKRLQWHVNTFGCLSLPDAGSTGDSTLLDERDSADVLSEFESLVPGRRILTFRDEEMSAVLRTSVPLPPNFSSGKLIKFLPFVSDEEADSSSNFLNFSIEACLLRNLLELENNACFLNPIGMPYPEEGHGIGRALVPRKRAGYVNILPPRPEDLPELVVARHDLSVISSRVYIENFGRYLISTGGAAPSSLLKGSLELRQSALSGGPSEALTSDSADLVDAWHKSGLSCKPGDVASSLLVYDSSASSRLQESCALISQAADGVPSDHQVDVESDKEMPETAGLSTDGAGLVPRTRANAYAGSFTQASTDLMRDGNQGSEPFVYFPPRFPEILRTTKRVKLEMSHVGESRLQANGFTSARPMDWSIIDDARAKRKAPQAVPLERNSKRPRIEAMVSGDAPEIGQQTTLQPLASSQHSEVPQFGSPAEIKVASRGIELGGESSGALRTVATEPALVKEDEVSGIDNANLFLDLGEDYGLLGIGVLALPEDSAREASLLDTDGVSYLNWIDPLDPDLLACDAEEADASSQPSYQASQLDAMLLYVTKRANTGLTSSLLLSRPYGSERTLPTNLTGTAPFRQHLPATAINASTALPYGIGLKLPNGPDAVANGMGSARKGKKKGQISLGGDVYARLAAADQAARAARDGGWNKPLASLQGRQGHVGISLFQSPAFRIASLRTRNRVILRVSQASMMPFGASPGVSFSPERRNESAVEAVSRRRTWTAAVLKVGSSTFQTGDDAKSKSLAERKIIRTSPTFPARVDFGPFQIGFISSRSGIAGIQPARPRIGISLPMGVKVAQHPIDPKLHPWASEEDETLKDYALRFGLNWHLLASAVNDFDDCNLRVGDKWRLHPRSARECRDRWHLLTEKDKSLAKHLPKTVGAGQMEETTDLVKPSYAPATLLTSPAGYHELPASKSLSKHKGTSLLVPSAYVGSRETTVTLEPTSGPSKMDIEREQTSEQAPKKPDEITEKEKTSEQESEAPSEMDIEEDKTSGEQVSEKPIEMDIEKKPSEMDVDQEKTSEPVSEKPSPPARRSFAIFRKAAAKKQDIPMRIPGFVAGEKPSLVPSHPSHAQAVQSAVASLPGSGAELWPLQLLDLKKRSSRSKSQGPASLGTPSPPRGLQPPGPFPPPPKTTTRTSPARKPS